MTYIRTTTITGFRITWSECAEGAVSVDHRHQHRMTREDCYRFKWMLRHQQREYFAGNSVLTIEGME